jgi:hypothetical protein
MRVFQMHSYSTDGILRPWIALRNLTSTALIVTRW